MNSLHRSRLLGAFLAFTILALASFLRFDGLGEPSLWLDELQHHTKTLETLDEPWHAWLTGVSSDRENGSLYYAGQLFGLWISDDEFGMRLAPALAGVATVGVVFLIGFSLGGPRTASVAALLLAVSPLHVYYSREGRPYAAVMLAAALFLFLALQKGRPWVRYFAYALCIATAYLGVVATPLLITFAGLSVLEWIVSGRDDGGARRRHAGHFFAAASLGLVLTLLLFPAAERLGTTLGKGKPTATTLDITSPLSEVALDRLLASLTVSGVDWSTATFFSVILVLLSVWGAASLGRKQLLPALWTTGLFVLPIVGMMAVLVIFDHWYNVRYTSAGLPAFLVLVGVGFTSLWTGFWASLLRKGERSMPWWTDLLLFGCLAFLLAPNVRASRMEPLQKPDWRGVAQLISDLGVPGEPVIARGKWAQKCISFYLDRVDDSIEVHSAFYDHVRGKELAREHPRAWVLAAGYRKTADFAAWMRTLDPVFSSRLGEIELYYSPGTNAFFSAPGRMEKLQAYLGATPAWTPRQEFGPGEMLLGAGWSYPETNQNGVSFRWAASEQVEVVVPAPDEARRRILTVRLRPFPLPDGTAQIVRVAVNGEPLHEITLQAGWNKLSLPPYDGHLEADLITFDFAWARSPQSLDPNSSPQSPGPNSSDRRTLAAAFDFVSVTKVLSSE